MDEKGIWQALKELDELVGHFKAHYTPESEAYYSKLHGVNKRLTHFEVAFLEDENGPYKHYLSPLDTEDFEENTD